MPKVVHFEIPAKDPEKVTQFYRDAFNWKIEKWGKESYWIAYAGPKGEEGINGAIYKKDWMDKTVNTIEVDDLDKYMTKIKNSGGKIVKEPKVIPHVGRIAYGEDPEGNMFGVLESAEDMDTNMKM